MTMIYQCYQYRKILDEVIKHLDDRNQGTLLNMYSLCWIKYSESVIEGKMSQDMSSLCALLPQSQKLTITDVAIKIWIEMVFDKDYQDVLIFIFNKLLQDFRFPQVNDNNTDQNDDNTIHTLRQFFYSCCDLSCTSDMVPWIGHSKEFKGKIFQQTTQNANDQTPIIRNNKFEQVQIDLERLKNVFGLWVVQNQMEESHLETLRKFLNYLRLNPYKNLQIDFDKFLAYKNQMPFGQSSTPKKEDYLFSLYQESVSELKSGSEIFNHSAIKLIHEIQTSEKKKPLSEYVSKEQLFKFIKKKCNNLLNQVLQVGKQGEQLNSYKKRRDAHILQSQKVKLFSNAFYFEENMGHKQDVVDRNKEFQQQQVNIIINNQSDSKNIEPLEPQNQIIAPQIELVPTCD